MKKTLFAIITIFAISSCAATIQGTGDISWFIHPKQNDGSDLYGVAEGFTLEEATKSALADAASRLLVTISSDSTLLREENNVSANQEMRQKIQQNIEKIDFTDYKLSRSENLNQKFYVEVKIDRSSFIDDQQKSIVSLEKQIADLDVESQSKNVIGRRNALVKIVDLGTQLEMKSRILNGAGVDVALEKKLIKIADYKTALSQFSDKIEFFFDIDSSAEVTKVIRNALNREQIKIARSSNPANKNQVIIRVKAEEKTSEIYESYVTKLEVDFENVVEGKVAASNSVDVSGASAISAKQSYSSALKSLEDKIRKDGIMKIIGLI